MTQLKIEGMTCPHCVKAVSQALAAVDGVTKVVSVELDPASAEVEGNAQPAALIAAVEAEGYSASAA